MEDSPIIQEVPSKAHINPQLDSSVTSPKQAAELNKAMADFWKETDEKEAAAKAPSPPPIQEQVEEKPAEPVKETPEAKEPPKQEPVKPAPEVKERKKEPVAQKISAPLPPETPAQPESPKPDAAESLELSPAATQEQKGQFKQLKEILKESQQKLKLYQDVFTPLLREIGHQLPESADGLVTALTKAADDIRAFKSSAMTADVKAELELLRGLQRAIDVVHSPEFINQYTAPRDKLYFQVIDEIAKNCGEELQDFFKQVKEKFRPNNMDDNWWEDIEGRMVKASNIERTRIHDKVAKLKELQMDFDRAVVDRSADQKGYQAWVDERQKLFSENYQQQVQAATSEAFQGVKKHLAHWLPQENNAKDAEERKKIDAHNARFEGLKNDFTAFLVDSSSGPRTAALRALDYLEARENAKELKEQLETATAEAEELRQEVGRLKAEVDKRRKIADAPMKQTAGPVRTGPQKAKAPVDGMKSLNEAMKNFNWPT